MDESNRHHHHHNNNNHVLVFLGHHPSHNSAPCLSDSDCAKVLEEEPYRFSSRYAPLQFHGQGLLSNDPALNPVMYAFHKWAVYDCSNDLYLGSSSSSSSSMRSGTIYRHGHDHVQSVLDHVVQHSTKHNHHNQNKKTGQLVVVGISSSGTLRTLNQLPALRRAAQELGVAKLKLVLEEVSSSSTSALSSSRVWKTDFKTRLNLATLVNRSQHPLCYQTANHLRLVAGLERLRDKEEEEDDDETSSIPCCLSTHCLLQRGILTPPPMLSPSTTATNDTTVVLEESVLVLDSTYDVHSTWHFSKPAPFCTLLFSHILFCTLCPTVLVL